MIFAMYTVCPQCFNNPYLIEFERPIEQHSFVKSKISKINLNKFIMILKSTYYLLSIFLWYFKSKITYAKAKTKVRKVVYKKNDIYI